MVSSLVKANLKLAGMNYVDLSDALKAIGVEVPPKNISSKLVRGSFSAVFLLQSLSVMGVETLSVPIEGRATPAGD
ncbi:hypothetical protein EAH79_11705 [Sphingomonas koreensis]|nr:hypothetical protein EAH79_11705 [Sphingomonas koreensis]